MVAIIGGEPHRFRPLIDRYRQAGLRAIHSPDQLKVGIHSLGYVASGYAASLVWDQDVTFRLLGPTIGYPDQILLLLNPTWGQT